VGAATVVVGTQFIGVAPPAGHISPYCDQAYQCIQPLSDPLTPCGARSLVRAAVWSPERSRPLRQLVHRWGRHVPHLDQPAGEQRQL